MKILGVKIQAMDTLLVCLYRPLDTFMGEWDQAIRALSDAICELQSNGKFSTIVLVGDLNLPEIDWTNPTWGACSTSNGVKGRATNQLLSLMEDNFLTQLILSPT